MEFSYHFNSFLREVYDAPKVAEDYLREERKKIASSDLNLAVRLMSELGNIARILGKLVESELILEKALREFAKTELSESFLMILSLRYAHVLQFQKRFAESNQIISKVIERCENETDLKSNLHLAYQYSGRNLFDQGYYKEALRFFEKAKSLQETSHPKFLRDTLDAINITNSALQASRSDGS